MYKYVYFISIIFTSSCSIILPFYTEIKNKEYLNFSDRYFINNETIDFYIGNPIQKIPVYIKFHYFPFYISVFSNIYNPKISSTYKQKSERINFCMLHQIAIQGFISEETFNFIDIENKNLTANNLTFFLETIPLYNISGILGLNLIGQIDNSNYSLLYNLKKNNLIKNYTWTYEYIDDKKEKGKLIIGEYPHIYNPKKYKKEKLKFINADLVGSFINWYILFNTIKIGIFSINIRKCLLELEFGLIKGNKQLEEIIINNYFKGKKFEKTKEHNYYIYYFRDKSIIEGFPYMNFTIKELNQNFILTKEDLFTEFKGYYYLNIVFPEYDEIVPFWILGKIFLKKYQFIFDFNAKIIGYYTENISSSKPYFVIFLIFLLIILIFFFISFYFKLTKKRKIRQNEINDVYEYISQD